MFAFVTAVHTSALPICLRHLRAAVPPAHHRARAPHGARRVSHRPRGGLLSELWQPAPRTAEAKAAHAAAEADRSARPERYRLDPETVASAAAKHPDDLERFAPEIGRAHD